MGTIIRGIKNAFRNSIRTISIVFILAVSISMALVMLMSLKTVQIKIDSVKSSIGNYISVSPAGIRGFEGGGQLLADGEVSSLSSISNVKNIVKTISDRVTNGQDTNLQSAIDPGSFGARQRTRNGAAQTAPSGTGSTNSAPQNFSMPISLVGTTDLSVTANLNVSSLNVTSGDKFDVNTTDTFAMVGTALATKNNLSVGSTFQAYGKDVKVVGIFDGGNTFANATAILPYQTLQNLSGQSGQISQVTVEANSIDNVTQVQSDIKTKLGDKADVVSQQDSSTAAIAPLENIRKISLYSLIGALVAGTVIIFLTMVMIVRERRREIGVLKAIGASNATIMAQFTVESLVLTLMSSVVGIILGLVLSNPILNVLVNNSQSATQTGGPGGGARAFIRIAGGAGNAVRNLHATVGTSMILYGLGAAILIAIIGSAIPSYLISKVRPAEVLRSE